MRHTNPNPAPTLVQNLHKISISRGLRAGNHGDILASARNFPFSFDRKKPFARQFRLQNIKTSLQISFAARNDLLNRQAELSPIGELWLNFCHNLHPIFERKTHLPHGHKTAQTRFFILQIKKHEFILINLKTRNLSFNQNARQSFFENIIAYRHKIRHAKNRRAAKILRKIARNNFEIIAIW